MRTNGGIRPVVMFLLLLCLLLVISSVQSSFLKVQRLSPNPASLVVQNTVLRLGGRRPWGQLTRPASGLQLHGKRRMATSSSSENPKADTQQQINEKKKNTAGVPYFQRHNSLQRALLAATATPFLSHEAELPLITQQLISDRAKTIFGFMVSYLEHVNQTNGWDVDLYASGGYVRDLLLGRVSTDLDLSLGLLRCPANLTVAALAHDLEASGYCHTHPGLGVSYVNVASRRSAGAALKDVDAVVVQLVLAKDNSTVAVDLLPTIRGERYDSHDRIPVRTPRGTAQEDCLRRDLTIGSMLLQVTTKEQQRLTRFSKKKPTTTSDLKFLLLDYYGGIEDVATRTLRCPVPQDMSLPEVWNETIQTKEDSDLAQSLGLNPFSSNNLTTYSHPHPKMIQTLWWAKKMMEDPYRILRTLRFAATLGFRVDVSFWWAVPFCLGPEGAFEKKVSHTRKMEELRKVATAAGGGALLNFFRTVLYPPMGGAAFRNSFFAVPLDNIASTMDDVMAYRLLSLLPPGLTVDETVGAILTVALVSCDDGGDNNDMHSPNDVTTACLGRTLDRVDQVCEGLVAPNEVRKAARDPVTTARRLMEPLPADVSGMSSIFVRAIAWPQPLVPVSMEERAEQFGTMIRLWDLLHLDPWSARRHQKTSDPRWVLGLLAAAAAGRASSIKSSDGQLQEAASEKVRHLEADTQLLCLCCGGEGRRVVGPQPQGGALLGSSVAGLPEVPSHLRGQMMSAVHVLSRLRGDAMIIETPEDLREYLEERCNGLLTNLANEWWVKGVPREGNLRPIYEKKK